MSQITLQLPETLYQELAHLAEGEGVSLNQFIIYALTRQATSASYRIQSISKVEVEKQHQEFQLLINQLGQTSSSEIETVLAEREHTMPEPELNPDVVSLLQERIRNLV
jgi:uncharacterized membrane protein